MIDRMNKFIAFALPALVAATAAGQTSYYPYNELDSPTMADILTYSGKPRSIMVQIVNLTPYEITYTPAASYLVDGVPVASPAQMLDKNRFAKKSFIFAPVGVPKSIPPTPPEAFSNSSYVNTTTHPYAMVLSWDDQARFVDRSSLFWTVKGVQYCKLNADRTSCTPGEGDATVGLFMSRIAPELTPKSSFFMIASDIVSVAYQVVKIVVTGSPTAWVKAALAVKELADDAKFVAMQSNEDEEGKMYISAYAVPSPDMNCYKDNSTSGCQPSASAHDDASDATWHYDYGGYPASEIVVMTQVIRGQKATINNAGDGTLGQVPLVMVTIMRTTEYETGYLATLARAAAPSSGGPGTPSISADVRADLQQLAKLLDKHGVAGLSALRSILAGRTTASRVELQPMLRSMLGGKPLTNAQRQKFHALIIEVRHELNEKEAG